MDTWRVEPSTDSRLGLPAEIARYGAAGLSLRLTALQQKLEREHPLTVALDITDRAAADGLPPDVTAAIHAIFLEGALNAAHHARGTLVRLVLHVAGDSVMLRIEDDGRGFAFKGSHDLRELLALGIGSQTLARLVAICGGRLLLDSRPTGSRIEIALARSGLGEPIAAPSELAQAS